MRSVACNIEYNNLVNRNINYNFVIFLVLIIGQLVKVWF